MRRPHLCSGVTRHFGTFIRTDLDADTAMLTAVVVSSVGLASKAFLASGYCGSVTVTGLPILLNALNNTPERNKGQGVITGV